MTRYAGGGVWSHPMKHIIRMVVIAIAFASLLGASPLLAQHATEPDEKPAPVDNDPWYCGLICLAGNYVGCQCGGAPDPTTCRRGCQDALYIGMNRCSRYDPADARFAACIQGAEEGFDDCMAACG